MHIPVPTATAAAIHISALEELDRSIMCAPLSRRVIIELFALSLSFARVVYVTTVRSNLKIVWKLSDWSMNCPAENCLNFI